MRPGMPLLLDLLRGQASIHDGSERDWLAVLDLAEQENILPWTAALLRAMPDVRPFPQLGQRLREIHRDAQISAFFWASALRSILTDFHDRGIPVVVLKGPWLTERLCGDAALRPCCDLDLLVRPQDVIQAETLLADLGFSPRRLRDDHERPWRRGAVTVDLHHDVEHPLAFNFDVQRAWERTEPSPFHGVPARLLSPADELVFLCLHSARHCFERLSHVLDLTFAFRSLPAPPAGSHAERNSEITSVLALGEAMAARLDPRGAKTMSADTGSRNRRHLEELADQLWLERITRPCASVDWRAKHEFYLRMETHRARRFFRRLRHGRILLDRLIDADFAFAERFHLRQRWQVWLLRPVRLLFHVGRASPSPP